MAYATIEDIRAAYGNDELLLLADRDRDGEVDVAVVDKALSAATSLIDSYISLRYPPPFAVVPELVRDMCVDIAVYKMAAPGAGLTDEKRTRYEDALSLLKRIADAKANLDIPQPAAAPVVAEGDDVLLVTGERIFTDRSLRGF